MNIFSRGIGALLETVSTDVGIDLGTANTLVYVKDKGVVINEPTIVAINTKTGQLVAVGEKAKEMYGRTPTHIQIVRPLIDGVISDFEVTEEMLVYLINRVRGSSRMLVSPRVLVGVPSGITNVEMRAARDAAKNAGARDVFLVEEPMAAAIGAKLPIAKSIGSMIVDIGGGTSDIAVISVNGIVASKNLRTAGDHFTAAIITYVRDQFKVHVGEKTAENAKIKLASITESDEAREVVIRGRDAVSGLPREVVITEADIREAIAPHIDTLVETIRALLERTPPEVLADVMQRGIHIAGGGALIPGLSSLLEDVLQVPVVVVPDPLRSVVRGVGIIVEDLNSYEEILIESEGELSPALEE
jgi:rod shape-determining protein MreB